MFSVLCLLKCTCFLNACYCGSPKRTWLSRKVLRSTWKTSRLLSKTFVLPRKTIAFPWETQYMKYSFPLTSYYFHHKSFYKFIGETSFLHFFFLSRSSHSGKLLSCRFQLQPQSTHLNHLIKEFRATWQLQAGVLEQGWKWSLQDGSSPGAELEFPVFQLHML